MSRSVIRVKQIGAKRISRHNFSRKGVYSKCQLTVSRGGLTKVSADCHQGDRKLPNLVSADIWMTPYRGCLPIHTRIGLFFIEKYL